MKNVSLKKLQLNKETIINLSDEDQKNINGGLISDNSFYSCLTYAIKSGCFVCAAPGRTETCIQ